MPPATAAVVHPPPSGGSGASAGDPAGGPTGDEEGRPASPGDGEDVGGRTASAVEADPSTGSAASDPAVAPDLAPTLKVAAVARRLGVAPATLRTWARRYGLGPSAHTAGAHRQYSLPDLDRLMVMRRMTLEGYSPAEAARVALQTTAAATFPEPPPPERRRTGAPRGDGPGRERTAWREPPPALRTATPSVRSLARAASALQAGECARQVEAHAAVDGVLETWTSLVRPVLQVLSDRVGAVAPGRSPGLLLEAALLQALRSASEGEPGEGPGRPDALVVRPCQDDERAEPVGGPSGAADDLLAHVVAAALRESGAGGAVLPGAHPAERTAAVAEQVDATTLVVVADAPVAADLVAETARLVDPGGARVVLVGRGWGDAAVPGAEVVADLGDAVAAVTVG